MVRASGKGMHIYAKSRAAYAWMRGHNSKSSRLLRTEYFSEANTRLSETSRNPLPVSGLRFSCPSLTPFGYAEEPLWVTDTGSSARWKTLCCELKGRVARRGRAFSAVRMECSDCPASPLPTQKRLSGVKKGTFGRTAFSVLQNCIVKIFYCRKRIFMQRRDAFPEYFRMRLLCLFGIYPYFCPAYMISGKILNKNPKK